MPVPVLVTTGVCNRIGREKYKSKKEEKKEAMETSTNIQFLPIIALLLQIKYQTNFDGTLVAAPNAMSKLCHFPFDAFLCGGFSHTAK